MKCYFFKRATHKRNSRNDYQNLHSSQGKLDLKLVYKGCVNVFCM